MTKLTKADILAGATKSKTVTVKSLNGDVEIRPLTDNEYAEVEAVMSEAISFDTDMDDIDFEASGSTQLRGRMKPVLDVAAFARSEHKSNCLAAAHGLSVGDESWTAEEVGRLPAGAPKEIAEIVFEYSGVAPGQEEVLRSFREKQERTGDRSDATRRRAPSKRSRERNAGSEDRAVGSVGDAQTSTVASVGR